MTPSYGPTMSAQLAYIIMPRSLPTCRDRGHIGGNWHCNPRSLSARIRVWMEDERDTTCPSVGHVSHGISPSKRKSKTSNLEGDGAPHSRGGVLSNRRRHPGLRVHIKVGPGQMHFSFESWARTAS